MTEPDTVSPQRSDAIAAAIDQPIDVSLDVISDRDADLGSGEAEVDGSMVSRCYEFSAVL